MLLPSWLTWYKKPEYRDIKEYSTAVGSGRRPLSPDGRNKSSIPPTLRLERVLENKTCSPMSLYDFYMYLKYIEFSAENLEFYVWFKNYEVTYAKTEKDSNSFSTAESEAKQAPSPTDITAFNSDPEVAKETMDRIAQLISSTALCAIGSKCALPAPKPTLGDRVKSLAASAFGNGPSANANGINEAANPSTDTLLADSAAGRRAELKAVLELFVVPGAEKELNIPPAMRGQALSELLHSSDPEHLRPIADHVYQLLRNCSHRNFVRLGVSNGTFETICVATGLGIVLTVVGFLLVLLRAFVPFIGAHSRFDAFASWPLWWLGMSLILSGLRGSCFFLLLFTRRQPLPWERFDDNASLRTNSKPKILKLLSRLMIFDRKFKVKDVHLRQLQHKIVLQSLFGGAVFASLGVALFIFLPVWSQTVHEPHHL